MAEFLEDRTLLSALTVNTTDDNTDADASLSLREAILLVNNGGDSTAAFGRALTAEELAQINTAEAFGTNDAILFDDNLAGGTIVLAGSELPISADVAILGLGSDQLTIDGGGLSRIFQLTDGSSNQLSVFISGLTLTGGFTEFDGGAIRNFENLTVDSSILTGNTAGGFSGAIDNFGSLIVTDSVLSGNSAGLGGGAIDNFGFISMIGSLVIQNSAGTSGGGISNRQGGELIIEDSAISENIARVSGGGIFNLQSLLTLSNTSLQGNSAANGGGIRNEGDTAVVVDSSLSFNTADFGGGIDNFQGELVVVNSTLANNSALLNGGAINNNAGSTDIFDSTFAFNSAQFGGGILNFQGELSVMTSSLTQNSAEFGGGIENFQGSATLTQSAVQGNTAGIGGGIRNLEGGLRLSAGTLTDNSATRDGGGIANINGAVSLIDSLLQNNTAANGGGIRNDNGTFAVTNSSLFLNTAGFGGGIDNSLGNLIVANSNVSGNLANENGGAINSSGTAFFIDTSITFNSARFGGGILNFQGELTVMHSSIVQNTAEFGGGIENFEGSLTVVRSDISFNSASNMGGGIRNLSGSLTATNTRFSNNSSVANGGGIANFGGTTAVSSSIFQQNFASGSGGAIHSDAVLTLDGSTIVGNFADSDGGGVSNDGEATITNSTLSGNFAGLSGGGIQTSGTLNVSNSTISQNDANFNGGGIRNFDGLTALTNVTIFGNLADADGNGTGTGGGLWTFNDGFTFSLLENTIVLGNVQGAAFTPSDIANKNVEAGSRNNLIGDPNSSGGLSDGVNGNIVGDGMGGVLDPNSVLDTTLRNNGGRTLTHALVFGSPAIDAGGDALAQNAGLTTDQRGTPFLRFAGNSVDIGSMESQNFPVNLVVDILEDEFDGNFLPGDLSLREAIFLSNVNPGLVTITFDSALAGGTIVLNGTELSISTGVIITGLGADQLTIDGGGLSRIFNVDDGDILNRINVAITGLALTGGNTDSDGGAILTRENLSIEALVFVNNNADNFGGAISSSGELTVTDSSLSFNNAVDGGAIKSTGALRVSNSSFFQNFALQFAGAIGSDGTATVTGSFLIGNFAGDSSGGIRNGSGTESGAFLTVNDSIISQNTAASFGGGIENFGFAAISNNLLFGNSAAVGAGIDNGSLMAIANTDIIFNAATSFGGGIDNILDTAILTVSNTTIRFNSAGISGGGINNNAGFALVTDIDVSFNTADSFGGGIENFQGGLTVTRSNIAQNTADFSGGGLDNFQGSMTVTDSTISLNRASVFGGGIGNFDGPLTVTNSTISGNTASALDGFTFGGGIDNFSGTATIIGGTISGNSAGFGGGLDNFDGVLSVLGATITGNMAFTDGGGIENFSGTLRVDNTVVSRNTAASFGGGIDHVEGTASITNSTIEKNTANFGGGILSFDRLTVIGTTLNHNSANFDGGGMLTLGLTEVTNSTISQNTASGDGGGIVNLDNLLLLNSVTIVGNRADADGLADVFGDGTGTGGGLWTMNDERTFTVVFNSIIAGNVVGPAGQSTPNDIANKNVEANSTNNLIGDPNSAGGLINGLTIVNNREVFNIIGDGNGNVIDVTTVLDTNLRFNGGPTKTHKLIPGSAAINAGRIPGERTLPDTPADVRSKGQVQVPRDPGRKDRDGDAIPIDPQTPGGELEIRTPQFDQRGPFFFRITGGQIDIGAYEVQFHIDFAIGSGTGIEAQVLIMDSGFAQQEFEVLRPYTTFDAEGKPVSIFTGGVRVALGDVNGDGFNEIITAAGPGGGPHVQVFDGRTFDLLVLPHDRGNFFAYSEQFTGGVFVAAGDLDGDGFVDIITGAGEGGGPHVRAFSGADGSEMFSFFAFNPLFIGGVRVAAGDITGDQNADIITAAGPGGGPHVRVFDGTKPQDAAAGINIAGPLGSFWAYEPTYTGGVYVAANNSGIGGGTLIVTGSGHKIAGASVGLFSLAGVSYFQTPIFAGVTVATFDFNRDGFNDYVTSTGQFASGQVIVFDGKNQPPFTPTNLPFGPQLFNELPFGNLQLGGLFVAGSTTRHDFDLEALDRALAALPLSDWE